MWVGGSVYLHTVCVRARVCRWVGVFVYLHTVSVRARVCRWVDGWV